VKSIGPRSEVRKAIQASVFRSLGFDIGVQTSAAASDAVFKVLAEHGIVPGIRWRLVEYDPIEELRADNPNPPRDDSDEDGAVW
jgi:hypothetical protein